MHLKENDTIACPGYTCYVGIMEPRAVRLVAYIKQEVKHTQFDVSDRNTENVELQ